MPKLQYTALALGLIFSVSGFVQQAHFQNVYASELCKSCVRIGILPLKYDGNQKKIELYAQGTQDSLIHALSSVNSLIVVDRSRTHDVLKEIAFQQSAYVSEKTQVEVGQILGVEYLYTGSIQEVNGRLRIMIERINVATGQVNSVVQVTGPIQDLFELQDQIAQKILGQNPVIVTLQEQQEVRKNIQLTPSLTAYEYFSRGLESFDNKVWNQALTEFSKAIELDPNYTSAYINRGNVYGKLRQYDTAISDNNRAIELNPKSAAAYINRGNVYGSLQQYDKAISDYNKAIELDPKFAATYINRGNVYGKLRQYDRAISDYNKAIELDPKFAVAYNSQGNVYGNLQQYDKAISHYNKAIELDPKFAIAYSNRGNVYRELQQYDKAISDCNKAIELEPKLAMAY